MASVKAFLASLINFFLGLFLGGSFFFIIILRTMSFAFVVVLIAFLTMQYFSRHFKWQKAIGIVGFVIGNLLALLFVYILVLWVLEEY